MDAIRGISNAVSCSVLIPSSYLRPRKKPDIPKPTPNLKNAQLAKALRRGVKPMPKKTQKSSAML